MQIALILASDTLIYLSAADICNCKYNVNPVWAAGISDHASWFNIQFIPSLHVLTYLLLNFSRFYKQDFCKLFLRRYFSGYYERQKKRRGIIISVIPSP